MRKQRRRARPDTSFAPPGYPRRRENGGHEPEVRVPIGRSSWRRPFRDAQEIRHGYHREGERLLPGEQGGTQRAEPLAALRHPGGEVVGRHRLPEVAPVTFHGALLDGRGALLEEEDVLFPLRRGEIRRRGRGEDGGTEILERLPEPLEGGGDRPGVADPDRVRVQSRASLQSLL